MARVAGVSLATASRAFSGLATVDPALVARVREAGARLGYQPNVAAQMTARGSSALVGVVSDHLREPRFAAIARGIVASAGDRGLTVITSGAAPDEDSLAVSVRSLIGYQPRAILIAARQAAGDALAQDEIVQRYGRAGHRIVSIGRGLQDSWIRTVAADDDAGARALAHAVHGWGYRKPLIVGVDAQFPTEAARARSLAAYLAERGIPAATIDAPSPSRDEGYRRTAEHLVGADTVPDIILAVSDELAVGVMAALRGSGRPDFAGVGVTGFDDVPLAGDLVPALTTVRTHLPALGSAALVAALDPDALPVVPAAEVVVRASTPAAHSTAR